MNSLPYTPSPSPLLSPLHALWRWLMARPGAEPRVDRPCAKPHGRMPNDAMPMDLQKMCRPRSAAAAPVLRPLRVLQVVEAGQSPGYGARLRISGRMADVCAELDRLAAREARLH